MGNLVFNDIFYQIQESQKWYRVFAPIIIGGLTKSLYYNFLFVVLFEILAKDSNKLV